MLFGAVEGVAYEELAVGWPANHFDLEQGNPRVLALRHCDASLCILGCVDEGRGVFLIERVHEAHEEQRRADVNDLVVGEDERLPGTMIYSHIGSKTDAQVPNPVAHRVGVEADSHLASTVSILLLNKLLLAGQSLSRHQRVVLPVALCILALAQSLSLHATRRNSLLDGVRGVRKSPIRMLLLRHLKWR